MTAPPATLLVVDDEELNREGLTRRLQQHDYQVVAARNGREAIELLGGRRFDLVLLDIMMPGMNGLEVLKFLRRVDSLIDLPIVMVTAKGESEDLVEALELGANDYVTKPLDFPVVLARVRAQLALRRAVAQVKELEGKLDAHNKELQVAAADLVAANNRHTQDVEAAGRIQRAFLPALPTEVPGARFAWVFEPCTQLAGDFLNVFRPDDRHVGLCVLDVSGHGVAAALLTVAVSQLLARVAGAPREGPDRPAAVPPTEVAARLGRQLTAEATAGHALSLLYGVLALDSGELRFVSAGHPGPVHLTEGRPPAKLEVTGFPIGVGGGRYTEQRVSLRPGDRVVLYSDGLTEVRNAEGEHFGSGRLLAALDETRRLPLADALGGLVRAVEGWRGAAPRKDGISILAVERTEPAAPGQWGEAMP
jgi:sigma-B regulation protein RsbU (phosphoserine phosphatase)